MAKPVPIGTRGQVEQRVAFEHTLTRYHEQLPPVLSTPDMIGLMEWACYVAAEPYCEGDEITVGTAINVQHLAATGIGVLVRAEAVLQRTEGKFYVYGVRAWDEQQEIGRGTVTRAFVSVQRFMRRVRARSGGADAS
jgi:predicted thioesterase